jgi:hypothetical protein
MQNPKKITRRLYAWEIQQLSEIFTHTLDLDRVWVSENNSLPDTIDRIGRLAKRMQTPKSGAHNAITWGNTCYFPVNLPQNLLLASDPEAYKLSWLVHEVTHIWQFQHLGWSYLTRSIRVQLKLGSKVYDYGGQEGLLGSRTEGFTLFDFNPEQQAAIVQHYYDKFRRGLDINAYQPFIDDIHRLPDARSKFPSSNRRR